MNFAVFDDFYEHLKLLVMITTHQENTLSTHGFLQYPGHEV